MPMAFEVGESDCDIQEMHELVAGYRACAEEAIRYLIEDEKVAPDDPLVLGLWQHLLLQEAELLGNHDDNPDSDDSGFELNESDLISHERSTPCSSDPDELNSPLSSQGDYLHTLSSPTSSGDPTGHHSHSSDISRTASIFSEPHVNVQQKSQEGEGDLQNLPRCVKTTSTSKRENEIMYEQK
ncbi:uncharacterized protein LOC106459090 [Limulus polyphemus]|uniref:Uncharacterized protein LOC106459090 n=1 Tax=Limulus polyphemus TaxID=6850 RepID=A0ABM1B3L7_LIMPO|nr:uncharacterized protein LOC106459090 [Limulus polyphemus]XP_022241291.1 uncharacterized protein LOC106459090 [Limulus polyphemus]